VSERNDPYAAYNFLVEIDGLAAGAFAEVTGLGVKVEPIQYREGGDRQSVRQLAGQTEYSPVTLRYGLTQSHELWDWLMAAVEGEVQRKSASIVLLDDERNPVARWNLFEAWPSEWNAAALNALENEIAIESLTLVYESLQREN
jgi:phage tail-like protein